MGARADLEEKIANMERTYAQTENVIATSNDPKRVDAAIRYLAGCGTQLASLRRQLDATG